jgi:hypothetical protein
LFTSLGIYVCTFTSFVALGVYGLDLIPTTIWVSVVINGTLVIVTIDLGITTKYNGIDFIGSILKLEVPA